MPDKDIYVVAASSADTNKYWYKIFRDIKNAGMKVYCVNPKISETETGKIYPDLKALPERGNILIAVARPEISAKFADEAAELGYKEIWYQPGAYEEKSAARARQAGADVHDDCFMLASGLW